MSAERSFLGLGRSERGLDRGDGLRASHCPCRDTTARTARRPVGSPANCSRRRFAVWTMRTAVPATRIVRVEPLVWNTGACRHLGAEPEAPGGFGARGSGASRHCCARSPRPHRGMSGMTVPTNRLVLGRTKTPWARRWISPSATRRGKGPVDGASTSVLQEAGAGEGLAHGQLPYGGSNGFRGRHGLILSCPKK